MGTKDILISMARYTHAFHDVELDVLDPNLQVKLKQFMDQTDDTILHEYWDEYKLSLNPEFKKPSAEKPQAIESKPKKTDVYYRGVKVESVESDVDDGASKDSGVIYRGKKV